jgi:hypothetical protein
MHYDLAFPQEAGDLSIYIDIKSSARWTHVFNYFL